MVITFPLVLFLCINFILLYLFLRTVDQRKWLVGILSLVLTPLAYFYVFYPFLTIITPYHHQKYFDADQWKEKPSLRYEMIDQMETSEELIGLTEDEATKQLGTAEWYRWDEKLKKHDSTAWHYGLGIEPGAFNNKKTNAVFVFENGVLKEISTYKEEISHE